MAVPETIRRKVEAGTRFTAEEGAALLREASLLELGSLADAVRERLHPEGVVTYIIDRNINYTNVCTAQCAFCAFYRDLPSAEGYLLSKAQLAQKIEETLALGGSQILLQGGLHPDLGIEYYEELFSWMKERYPALWIHGFTAFIGWTFQPSNTALAGDELTSFQYLRTLAVARVMLDNFPSVQASWVTQGGKIGQVSLRFGANDFGSLMIEENVVSAA